MWVLYKKVVCMDICTIMRQANNHDPLKDRMDGISGSSTNHANYTPLGLELKSLKRMNKSENPYNRGSSEYYCQIDESLMREFEGDNPGTVTPDSPLGPGYIELHYDDVGIASYDECNSSGPIQAHTYKGGAGSTEQGESDDLELKASSYDQLESAHRSKPPKPPVYRCLNNEREEPGYIELLDDEHDAETITKYEPSNRSGPNPVHLYEKRRDTRDQEEERGDIELKVSKYDQLDPTHRSGLPKPSEYRCLDTERAES